MQKQIFKNDILRFPRLDTILMVEKKICISKGDMTVTEIWKKLPRKVMWQTYLTVLDYLEYSGKIYIDKDKHAVWIWSPNEIEKLKIKNLVLR